MGRVAGCYGKYSTVNKRDFKDCPNWLRYGHFWIRADWKALKLRKGCSALWLRVMAMIHNRGCMAVIFCVIVEK